MCRLVPGRQVRALALHAFSKVLRHSASRNPVSLQAFCWCTRAGGEHSWRMSCVDAKDSQCQACHGV